MNPIRTRRTELLVFSAVSMVVALTGIWVICKGHSYGWAILIPFAITALLLLGRSRRPDCVIRAELDHADRWAEKHPLLMAAIVISGILSIGWQIIELILKMSA